MKRNEIKQVRQIDALEFNMPVKERLNQFKVSAITAAIIIGLCRSITYAADLEIYKVPEEIVSVQRL